MARKVGGFALLSAISTQPDYYSLGDNGALVPVELANELEWLSSMAIAPPGVPATGLLKSWDIPPGDPDYNNHIDECLVHEQALAVIASLAPWKSPSQTDKDRIELFVKGLLSTFKVNWEVPYSVNKWSGAIINPVYRTTTQAWAIYALALYCYLYPQGTQVFQAKTTLVGALPMLTQYQVSEASSSKMKGLITTGRGNKLPGGGYNDTVISYAQVDDNVVSWLALHSSSVVLGLTLPSLAGLNNNISNFWDVTTYRYRMTDSGFVPTLETLGTHLYGGLWSLIQKDPYRANLSLFNMTPYKYFSGVQGLVPVLADRGFPGVTKQIWCSGTFGFANLARRVIGNSACDLAISAIGSLRGENGGWRGTLDPDSSDYIGEWSAVRNSAHAVLAMHPDIRDIFVAPLTGLTTSGAFVDPAFVDPAFVE